MKKELMNSKKMIYNPVTKKYYEVRQRTTPSSSRGQIKTLWSSKKSSSTKKEND